jgi:outer membrane protein assembly factor BamE (lipoprotein component of BamABCDE complex)
MEWQEASSRRATTRKLEMSKKSLRTLCIAVMLAASAITVAPAFAAKVDDPSLYTTEALQKNLVLGKTTKEEVRTIYGEPSYVNRTSAKDGNYENSWTYFPSESHGEKVRKRVTGFLKGMLPGNAATATSVAQEHGVAARNVKDFSLRIEFDKSGIVQDYRQSEDNDSKDAL